MDMVSVDAWLAGVRADPRLGPGTRRVAAELARHFRTERNLNSLDLVSRTGLHDPERALQSLRRYGWLAGDLLAPTMSTGGCLFRILP
jgi:hypothetical protein